MILAMLAFMTRDAVITRYGINIITACSAPYRSSAIIPQLSRKVPLR